MSGTVEQAVQQERSKIDFQPQKIAEFLYGVKEYAEIKEKLEKSDVIPYDFNIFNRGRVEILKQTAKDFPLIAKNTGTQFSDANMIYASLALTHQMPGMPHIGMFMKCIEFMGTEEQKKEYLPKCKTFQIVGSYSQTQIGHGSDVSSLQTIATFNIDKDQFIIQTSSISATKFWPGDLGIFSTHALVFAQLFINGKNYGVQPFIVQVRDQNMKLLPGIQAGDIGPKIGYHGRDNGYMILKKISVPRKNMLARFVTIQKNGTVKTQGNPKVAYATMMQVRKMLAYAAPKIYASAITIATKYSLFRRQFKNDKKQQIKIMDYQLQQQKIIERIAQYFAISVAGRKIKNISNENVKRVLQKDDFSLMQQTHVCLSLGKCFFSELVYDGMQICRKACGGHGFSQYSGFVALINEYAPHNTQEGQNTVLYLQIARHLVKSYKGLVVNKKQIKDQSIKYIKDYNKLLAKKSKVSSPQEWTTEELLTILGQTVCYLISVASEKIVAKQQGMSQQEVFNKIAGINLRDLGVMHSAYFSMHCLKEAVDKESDKRVKAIAQNLCLLFGANFLMTRGVAAIQGGFLTKQQMRTLGDLKQILLSKLRPDVIGIVDGFGIPQKYVRSQLTHGNPYQNFLKLARQCDLNKQRMPSVDLVLSIKNHLTKANPKL